MNRQDAKITQREPVMHDSLLSVDVLIPVHNGARFLEEAIHSVLVQTYPFLTILVIDDGSMDQSATIAARFPRVHVLQQPHRGIGAAINLALRHAQGTLLASVDADDRWLPDKLEKQVNALVADPDLDIVFGYTRQFYQPTDPASAAVVVSPPQSGIARSGMLARRTAFDRVGPFAEDPTIHQFVDWYARACEAGLRMHTLPDIVFERRVHEENMSRREPAAQRQSYLRALRLSAARRKSAAP